MSPSTCASPCLQLREVIIEVEQYGRDVVCGVHVEVVKLFFLIPDPIIFQIAIHVQVLAIVFPCVAGSVCIIGEIAVQDFPH